MLKIAFVTFQESQTVENNKAGFLAEFLQWIFKTKKKLNINKEIEEINLFDNESISVISIPLTYSIKEFKDKKEAIEKKIIAICNSHKVDKCIVPVSIAEDLSRESELFQSFSGMLLFKSLILLLIEEICKRRESTINEMDISIVQGDSAEELITFVKILSPHIRYLTLITSLDKEIEDELNSLYIDTGLAVGINSDLNRSIRNKDIIVNLGNLNTENLHGKIFD
jgi:hypothetical protein